MGRGRVRVGEAGDDYVFAYIDGYISGEEGISRRGNPCARSAGRPVRRTRRAGGGEDFFGDGPGPNPSREARDVPSGGPEGCGGRD